MNLKRLQEDCALFILYWKACSPTDLHSTGLLGRDVSFQAIAWIQAFCSDLQAKCFLVVYQFQAFLSVLNFHHLLGFDVFMLCTIENQLCAPLFFFFFFPWLRIRSRSISNIYYMPLSNDEDQLLNYVYTIKDQLWATFPSWWRWNQFLICTYCFLTVAGLELDIFKGLISRLVHIGPHHK